jgi:hypothetical protein
MDCGEKLDCRSARQKLPLTHYKTKSVLLQQSPKGIFFFEFRGETIILRTLVSLKGWDEGVATMKVGGEAETCHSG